MSIYSPITADMNWFCGEQKVFRFTCYKDAVSAQNQDPHGIQPITGFTLEWKLKIDEPDPSYVLLKTTLSGITITDGPGGVCEVLVFASETHNLDPGMYAHALRRTDTNVEALLAHGEAVLQLAAAS